MGEQRKSHKLRIGRYAQHFVDALQMDDTPVEYLERRFPEVGISCFNSPFVKGKSHLCTSAGGAVRMDALRWVLDGFGLLTYKLDWNPK